MSSRPKQGKPPTIVAIQQYEAHHIVDERLQHLLENMHLDTGLNLGAATGALFGTAGDLIMRINMYMQYPYSFVRMCRKWFPLTFRHAITVFLQAADSVLDVGFSLPLQALALAQDGEMRQRAFMESDAVQDWLEEVAFAFFVTSLDAEREAAEVKRREGRNISLLANVSRDLLCTRFTRQRDEQARAIDAAAKKVEALKFSTWHSIAWEKHSAAPQGKRIQASASGGHGSATGGHVSATGGQGPATGGQDPDTVCHAPAQPSGGHGSATGGHGSASGGAPATSTSATLSTYSSCLQRHSVKSRPIRQNRQAIGRSRGSPKASMGQPKAAMCQPKAATGGEPSIPAQLKLSCERAIEAGSVERMEEEGQYLWCKDCQMWINGPGQWEDHRGGKKHRKNARKNARVKICSGQPIQRLFMCALCGAHPTIGCCVLCGRRCCRGCVEGETVFECWACSGFSSPPENIDSVVAFDGSEGSRCHQHLQVSDKGQTAGPTLMKQMVEWISLSEESKPGAEQPSAGKLGGGSGNPLL